MNNFSIPSIDRRKLLTGALLLSVSCAQPLSARALAAEDAFDGSWGGVDAKGHTAQLILASGQVIGFYWRGDYIDASAGKLGPGGASLSFTFADGDAVVSRRGSRMTIVIHDGRLGENRLELKKD